MNYKDLNRRFEFLAFKNNKTTFDENVREYSDLLYGRSSRCVSILGYNFNNIIDLIDDYMVSMMNTVWTFAEVPFIIENENSKITDYDSVYTTIAERIFKKLKDRRSQFNHAFSEFVRSRFELGLGVILIDLVDDKYYFSSIDPSFVQYDFNNGELIELIVKEYTYKEDFSVSAIKLTVLKHFKKDKEKWTYQKVFDDGTSSEKINLRYEPAFAVFNNVRFSNGLPMGKGIELLPILKNINNLQQEINIAIQREMNPIALCSSENVNMNTISINEAGNTNTGLEIITNSKTLLNSSSSEIDILKYVQVPIRLDAAFKRLEDYKNQIFEKLANNEFLLMKGRARMTSGEVNLRDFYDREKINNFASVIIDNFLIPILEILTDNEIELYKKENGSLPDDFKNYKIGVNNIIAKADKQERLKEIQEGFTQLAQLVALQVQTQGTIDIREAALEVSKLTSITSSGTTENTTTSLLRAVAENFSNQAGLDIATNNSI